MCWFRRVLVDRSLSNFTGSQKQGYADTPECMCVNLARHFGSGESLPACDTRLYDDYDKFGSSFDKDEKARCRAGHFEENCRRAFELGVRFAGAGPTYGSRVPASLSLNRPARRP